MEEGRGGSQDACLMRDRLVHRACTNLRPGTEVGGGRLSGDSAAVAKAINDAFGAGDVPGARGRMRADIVWNEASSFHDADANPCILPAGSDLSATYLGAIRIPPSSRMH